MSTQDKPQRPNILFITTDQQRDPPGYESDEVKTFRREVLKGESGLRDSGITFGHHYIMSAACTPSRASLSDGALPVAARRHPDRRARRKARKATTCSGSIRHGVPTMGD